MASSSSSSLAANQHQEEINIAISVDDASDQIEVEISHLLEKIRHDEQELPPTRQHDEQPRICRYPFGENIQLDDDFPKICSIGPIHSGRRSETGECDANKLRVFYATMSLQDGPQICRNLIRFVKKHKDKAAKYYSKEEEVVMDEEKFVIMLVLDAHFILRFLFKFRRGGTAETYVDRDLYERWITPYFSSYSTILCHDILLLSNQIPFFILKGCFDLLPPTNKPSDCSTLPELLLSVYFDSFEPPSLELISQGVEQFDHLLHFFRNGVNATVSDPPQRRTTSNLKHKICNRILTTILYLILFPWFCFLHLYQSFISHSWEPTAVTAVELQDAGVKFKSHFQGFTLEDCIMKIWFEGGTLNLPSLDNNDNWFSLMNKISQNEQELPPLICRRHDEQPRICRHPFGENIQLDDDFPKICSIGPIHSGRRPETAKCDADKLRLFGATKSRQDGPQICRDLIRFVQQHKDEAAKYYSKEEEVVMDEEKFVIMLVLDAHLILRLLFRYYATAETYKDKHLYESWILTDVSSYYTVKYHDFLLLSNQIPFFILEGCFDLLPPTNKPRNFSSSLPELLLSTYFIIEPPSLELISQGVEQFDHLLHFYRNAVIASNLKHKICNRILTTILCLILFPWFCFLVLHWLFISQKEPTAETAVELQDAGVKFKSHWGSDLEIWFEGGTLNLRRLSIDDYWFSRMWNLLAFEKIRGEDRPREFTIHLKFLCDLVRSKDDYRLLAEHEILCCRNGEDFGFEKIKQLKLTLSTVIDAYTTSGWYRKTIVDMKQYMREPQHRWRAKLMKDYFNNPWSIVGWVVGGVLLILTLLQTIYTIKSFYHSPS